MDHNWVTHYSFLANTTRIEPTSYLFFTDCKNYSNGFDNIHAQAFSLCFFLFFSTFLPLPQLISDIIPDNLQRTASKRGYFSCLLSLNLFPWSSTLGLISTHYRCQPQQQKMKINLHQNSSFTTFTQYHNLLDLIP